MIFIVSSTYKEFIAKCKKKKKKAIIMDLTLETLIPEPKRNNMPKLNKLKTFKSSVKKVKSKLKKHKNRLKSLQK